MAINERYNYDDVFLRDLTISVLAGLEDKIKWTNNFSTGPKDVNCKIYYSMTGKDDFLMDSFVDDIASNNRKVELNTDKYPSGWITLTGWNIRSSEFANPNVWLRSVVENQEEIKGIIAKVRALPITANYELTILLNSEIDTFKASQSIMNMLWMWKYSYFEFNFMNIDMVMKIPDDQSIQINREQNLSSDDSIRMTVNLEVSTYYPAFNENQISTPPYGSEWFGHLKYVSRGANNQVQSDFIIDLHNKKIDVSDNILSIGLVISNKTSIRVDVYDARANIIDTTTMSEPIDIGKHTINIDISDKNVFTTGIYYIKVTSDITDLTERIDII